MGPVIARDTGVAENARLISVAPTRKWDGNVGQWSSFSLGIGQPPQEIRVLASTDSNSIWAIDANLGCSSTNPIQNCPDSRGGLYDHTKSPSFKAVGPASIEVTDVSAFNQPAFSGFEALLLPSSNVSEAGDLIAKHQTLDIYNGTMLWMGGLGLNPRPGPDTAHRRSLLRSLKDDGQISSLSYGYGEGARYRGAEAFGSLTLGGYDQSLFTPTSVTFPIHLDSENDLTVGLQSIRTRNASEPFSMEMLDSPIYAIIDSTFPELWLPTLTCQSFESSFDLTYNATSGLYLLSEEQHSNLLKANPSVSFLIGPDANVGTSSINITLPYAAFDLNASWPLVNKSTPSTGQRYFPLRRTDDATQYRLGRTFLQEAYLVADYERVEFSIAPRVWGPSKQANLTAISTIDSSTNPNQPSDAPSFNTVAGIVIGCVGGILLILFISMLLLMRRRREQIRRIKARRNESPAYGTDLSTLTTRYSTTDFKEFGKPPVHDHWYLTPPIQPVRSRAQSQPQSRPTMDTIREAQTPSPYEMSADPIRPHELYGSAAAPLELESRASPGGTHSIPFDGQRSYLSESLYRSGTVNTIGTIRSPRSSGSIRTRLSIPSIVVEEDKDHSAPAAVSPVELPAVLPAELLERRRLELERSKTELVKDSCKTSAPKRNLTK